MLFISRKLFYVFVCLAFLLALIGIKPAYAASIVVNSNANNIASDSQCTLREAVQNANDNAATNVDCSAGSGDDTITFNLSGCPCTITLTSQININSNITITGLGASTLTISGGNTNVIFSVGAVTLNLSQVTITGGSNPSGNGGGMVVNTNGVLNVSASVISGNTANLGAGIFSNGGTVTLLNSTVSNNSATGDGGGIYGNSSTSVTTITNSTITGNSSPAVGSALINGGTMSIRNSTIANNALGGGTSPIFNAGTMTLSNTIVANSDCNSAVTNGGNNIDTGSTCGFSNVNNSQSNTNPLLGSLTGSPAYFPLNTGSPAIDAGDNTVCAASPVNGIDQRGLSRPQGATCDIGAYEKMDASGFPTFVDVPTNASGWAHIESINYAGITSGCTLTPLNYCPNNTVTRTQMAVFLLRGIHGSSYTPPAATGTVFNDVPLSNPLAAWIEQFAAEGITSGCGGGNYCPNASVTRDQMAIFILRAKYGSAYIPPAATGTMFNDVPLSHPFAAWIEQLSNVGITGGCGGGNYCPANSVTRAQMAIFIQRTFNLPLP